MDLNGIGFSDIRMSNKQNDYTYIYDSRINVFPEEVYIHEFLHTLERTLLDYEYKIPALHDNLKYGYEQEKLIGLEKWYQDYMRCNISDENNNKIGLNEIVYTLKPAHESNFNYATEIEFNKENKNIIEDILSIIKTVFEGTKSKLNAPSGVLYN